MKRMIFLSGLVLCMMSCNNDSKGSGGSPAQDSVVPLSKDATNDKGNGSTMGGSSDPLNGGGPQTLPASGTSTGAGNGNTTTLSTDTSAMPGAKHKDDRAGGSGGGSQH